nr:transcription factor UNE12-like [Ipomoea batatas]
MSVSYSRCSSYWKLCIVFQSVTFVKREGAAAQLRRWRPPATAFPLGLSLDNGRDDISDTGGFAVKPERAAANLGNLYSGLEHLQTHTVRHTVPAVHQV